MSLLILPPFAVPAPRTTRRAAPTFLHRGADVKDVKGGQWLQIAGEPVELFWIGRVVQDEVLDVLLAQANDADVLGDEPLLARVEGANPVHVGANIALRNGHMPFQ